MRNAALLNIRIYAEGKIEKDAYIAFSKLNILIDDDPIDVFPVRDLSPLKNEIYSYTAINIDEEINLEQISQINNKKIIGVIACQ